MSRLVRVELLKLRTLRTTYGLLAAAALLTAFLASTPASKASPSTLASVVTLTGWSMLFAMVMGVIASSGEFRHCSLGGILYEGLLDPGPRGTSCTRF
jgi:hypothetical protein